MSLLKQFLRKTRIYFYGRVLNIFNTQKNVECPFCGWQGKSFLPFGGVQRKNAHCPKCGSLERHRLAYLYLKEKIPTDKKLKVLHFAPEKILTTLFKSYDNVDYLSADIDPKLAMVREDITKLSFKDNSFDIIFCYHVLEHIEEDAKAMSEMHRVLKPGGFAILQVPMADKNKTFEDPTITSLEDRKKFFWQDNHVRVYGRDYRDRLENAGFKVKIDKFVESLDEDVQKKYALSVDLDHLKKLDLAKEDIYFCTK
jgi:predicted SAM-dependent methyltransferase